MGRHGRTERAGDRLDTDTIHLQGEEEASRKRKTVDVTDGQLLSKRRERGTGEKFRASNEVTDT